MHDITLLRLSLTFVVFRSDRPHQTNLCRVNGANAWNDRTQQKSPPFVISLIIKNIEVKTARSRRARRRRQRHCGNSRGAGVTAGAGLLGVSEGVSCQINAINTKNNKKKPKTQTTQNADTTLLISSRTRARPCFPKRIKFAKVFFTLGEPITGDSSTREAPFRCTS